MSTSSRKRPIGVVNDKAAVKFARQARQTPKISYSDRSAAERLAANLSAAAAEIKTAIKSDDLQRLEDLMKAWSAPADLTNPLE